MALQVRYGSLGNLIMFEIAKVEFSISLDVSRELTEKIIEQKKELPRNETSIKYKIQK